MKRTIDLVAHFLFGICLGAIPGYILLMIYLSAFPAVIVVLVVALVYFFAFGCRYPRPLHTSFITITCIVAVASICILFVLGVPFIYLIEGGFDDGPFSGVEYTAQVMSTEITEKLPYRGGEITASRGVQGEVVLSFVKATGEQKWAVVLDPSTPEVDRSSSVKTIQLLGIDHGVFHDKIVFEADWTFGREIGYAYIWKNNTFSRFYLSW